MQHNRCPKIKPLWEALYEDNPNSNQILKKCITPMLGMTNEH